MMNELERNVWEYVYGRTILSLISIGSLEFGMIYQETKTGPNEAKFPYIIYYLTRT
jgi:hypothetical protein